MYFLVKGITCADESLARIMFAVKNIMNLIAIITPIILILMLSIHFTRAMINPDDKKNHKRFTNSIIALLVVFMMPVIMGAVMKMVGEKTKVSSCWVNAKEVIDNAKTPPEYINPHKDKKNNVIKGDEYLEDGPSEKKDDE